ncbi:hypothetical protein AOT82_1629 [Psychrobacter sp. AntiMn-1]|nr:hypothetical protein AOT82_1629 [Psychrobacter sp. AntiMn-1]
MIINKISALTSSKGWSLAFINVYKFLALANDLSCDSFDKS